MRNIFILSSLASVISLGTIFSGCEEVKPPIDMTESLYETGVGTPEAPDTKVVLIEDFTGAACPNCPDAHIAIEDAYTAYPGQVVAIAEYNYFADPLYIEQNMITNEALLLNDYLGPAIGWPASIIDRTDFTDNNYLPELPANVVPYVGDQATITPPCNISITNTFDEATRQLDVEIRIDYTSTVTDANNLSISLIESGIIAAQVDDNVGGEVEDYEHNHVLRKMLTNFSGTSLPEENIAGRWYIFNYSYTIPANWNADNMAVVAFVHNIAPEDKVVLQAAEAHVTE